MAKGKLTPKQERFCEEYLIDLNATQAAIRAGYSEKTAAFAGCDNLTKPNIRGRVQELVAKRSNRTQVKADQVVTELAKLGFSSIGDYLSFGPGGVILKESGEMTREQLACVAEVSQLRGGGGEGGTIRFKLHDKKGALELLGRHLGMFVDRTRHELSESATQAVAAAVKEIADKGTPPLLVALANQKKKEDFGKNDSNAQEDSADPDDHCHNS